MPTENDYLEAVFEALLGDDVLMEMVSDVVHISAEQGSTYPLLIVSDLASRTAYTSGGLDTERHFLTVETVALPGDGNSAYTRCKAILRRVRTVLQDLDESLATEDGTVINLRRTGSLAGAVTVVGSDEIYNRQGDEYELMVSQD